MGAVLAAEWINGKGGIKVMGSRDREVARYPFTCIPVACRQIEE
jgi:hypothetical protein